MTGPAAGGRARGFRPGLPGLSRLAVALTLAVALGGVVAGCGAPASAGGAMAGAPVAPGEDTAAPDLAGARLPDFVMPVIKGGISRPSHRLTPGDVTTTDTGTVCALQTRGVVMSIPPSLQDAVYAGYGYTSTARQHKYVLDYLVPWQLGGALDKANVWPVAVRGTGFYQKVQTDHALRALVCRGQMALTQAQQLEERDWYSAWLRYVVVAGQA